MKCFVTFLLLLFTSCVNAPTIPDLKPLVDTPITELPVFEKADNPTEQLQNNLVVVFTWLSIISAIGGVIAFAVGRSFPLIGDLQLGRTLGLIAIGSMGVVYATKWMWWIIGGTFWICLIYFLFRLARILKEKRYAESIVENLATHFDDPEGADKLSEDAKLSHLMNRSKGKAWNSITTQDENTQKMKTET